MKNKILSKLRSRDGASITFALLLFLVCAVLCSVIITAATAAAGRMSRIAQSDQRYFAVASAAELIKDAIEESPTIYVVEVERVTLDYDYGTTPPDPKNPDDSITFDQKTVYIIPHKDGTNPMNQIVITDTFNTEDPFNTSNSLYKYNVNNTTDFKIDSIQKDAAKIIAIDKSSITTPRLLQLESSFSSAAGLNFDALAVDIKETMDSQGNLSFTLYNTYESGTTPSTPGNRNTMQISFGVDKSTNTDVKTETLLTKPVAGSSHEVNTRITKITTTAFTWSWTGRKINS